MKSSLYTKSISAIVFFVSTFAFGGINLADPLNIVPDKAEPQIIHKEIEKKKDELEKSFEETVVGEDGAESLDAVKEPKRIAEQRAETHIEVITYVLETGDIELVLTPALLEAATDLSTLLERAYETHKKDAKPIPLDVKKFLSQFYDKTDLDNAMYTVSNGNDPTINSLTNKLNATDASRHAVVTKNIIVFSNQPTLEDENDAEFWAHEFYHTIQYKDWGIIGFSKRYIQNHQYVEGQAEDAGTEAKKYWNK